MIMKGPLENKVLIVQVPKALQFAFKSLKKMLENKISNDTTMSMWIETNSNPRHRETKPRIENFPGKKHKNKGLWLNLIIC